MKVEDAIAELRDMEYGDPEENHKRADEILCELVARVKRGPEVVAAFNNLEKWYA